MLKYILIDQKNLDNILIKVFIGADNNFYVNKEKINKIDRNLIISENNLNEVVSKLSLLNSKFKKNLI